MNWLRTKILRWLYPDEVATDAHPMSSNHPLFFMLGEGSTHQYAVIPIENGFALVTRAAADRISPVQSNGPLASVTFCSSAQDLSQTIIAKMAKDKLTAR